MDNARKRFDPLNLFGVAILVLMFVALWVNGDRVLERLVAEGVMTMPDPHRSAISVEDVVAPHRAFTHDEGAVF